MYGLRIGLYDEVFISEHGWGMGNFYPLAAAETVRVVEFVGRPF